MKLTDSMCRGFKPGPKPYKRHDGGGLYLLVKPNGQKYWRKKYSYLGKENTLAIGVYPTTSLAEAREARDIANKMVKLGQDPNATKKATKTQALRNAQNTFKATALKWYQAKVGGWSKGHAETVMGRLERDIFPAIGDMPIASIKGPDLLEALEKIEKRGAFDIVRRCRQICGQVFTYGVSIGRCEHNPAIHLRNALQTRKTKHFASIDPSELPGLVRAIQRNDARLYTGTRNALLFHLLTFVRPTELRLAKWSEFNLDEGQWVIPAERMKLGRPLIVPLSKQAIAILHEQREHNALMQTDWVFPSPVRFKEPMSDGTELMALRRLGYQGKMTAHGFRALARTVIAEKLEYAGDIVEVQLAHIAPGPLGEAYNRAQFLPQRRQMMQDWADHIDRVTATGEVIHGNFPQSA